MLARRQGLSTIFAIGIAATSQAVANSVDDDVESSGFGQDPHAWTSLEHQYVNLDNYPLAVCNDGSPGSYFVNRQIADSSGPADHWLVVLEGGGFCMSDENCLERVANDPSLTSSKRDSSSMPTLNASAHLTRIPLAMHDRVAVIVLRYCSSDIWVGNSTRMLTNLTTNGTILFQFRGAAIVDAVLRTELDAHPTRPEAVTLFGYSAGAIGASASVSVASNLLPGAEMNLIMDSPPPFVVDATYQAKDHSSLREMMADSGFPPEAVVNGKFDAFRPFLDWYKPQKDDPLLQTSVQTLGRGLARLPCLFDLVCTLEYLDTLGITPHGSPRIMMVGSLQDLYSMVQAKGFETAFDGIENGDMPPMTNFQVRLQNVFAHIDPVHKMTSGDQPLLLTLFAAACPMHGLTHAFFDPPLPQSGPNSTLLVGDEQFSREGFSFAATYDFVKTVQSEAYTDVLVDGTSAADALLEFATAIAAGNISADGTYGRSRFDTCNGFSCNPTCLGKMDVGLATTDLDKLRPVLLFVVFIYAAIFLCNCGILLGGRTYDRRTLEASKLANVEPDGATGISSNEFADVGAMNRKQEFRAGMDGTDSGKIRVVHFSCAAVTKKKTGNPNKGILKDISLELNPGLTAVMGPSGSGKTTLLNALAVRLDPTTLVGEGKIYFDKGIDLLTTKGHGYCARNTGYVMQLATPWDDVLTCRENLIYAAEIRLAPLCATQSAASRQKLVQERVKTVVEDLIMTSFADTVVGGTRGGKGGLSGGQKRKLSVAMQLLTNPRFLFLDEPTSGLDASTTMNLLRVLKNTAAQKGHTIVITIHQPRVEAWNLFDEVVVLADGRLVYQGMPKACVSYLSRLFYNDETVQQCIADSINPADSLLDSLHDHSHQVVAAASFKMVRSNRDNLRKLSVWALNRLRRDVQPPLAATLSWRNSCALEWNLFFAEYRRLAKATRWLINQSIMQAVVIAVVFGVLWYNVASPVGYLTGSFIIVVGPWTVLFAIVCNAMSAHKVLVINDVEDDVLKQRHFLFAAGLYMISLGAVCSMAMVAIMLPMMGDLTWEQFLFSAPVVLLSYSVLELGMLVSLSFKHSTELSVQSQAILLNTYVTMFGGFFVPSVQLQDTIGSWPNQASPVYNAMVLHTKNLLYNRDFHCDYKSKLLNCGIGSTLSGESILIGSGMAKDDSVASFALLLAWVFGLLALPTAIVMWHGKSERLHTEAIVEDSRIYRMLKADTKSRARPTLANLVNDMVTDDPHIGDDSTAACIAAVARMSNQILNAHAFEDEEYEKTTGVVAEADEEDQHAAKDHKHLHFSHLHLPHVLSLHSRSSKKKPDLKDEEISKYVSANRTMVTDRAEHADVIDGTAATEDEGNDLTGSVDLQASSYKNDATAALLARVAELEQQLRIQRGAAGGAHVGLPEASSPTETSAPLRIPDESPSTAESASVRVKSGVIGEVERSSRRIAAL
jgi:ATP-binding cassette subfamily G (WHITE) protein 2